MKTILATLNAKYIHTSLALRLLYVASKDKHDVSFREFVIKEDAATIADSLLRDNPQVVGLGVYIWNVRQTKELVKILKAKDPDVIIILGGPEVSYEPEFFLENWQIDYVIGGEGEFVLEELLTALKEGKPTEIASVSSLNKISREIAQADIYRIASLPSPYTLDEDREEMQHKIIYFETSRGCPYQCQYCLSSLEKGVRYFPQDYILANLKYLVDNGAKLIKFLDRTFNINKEHTTRIFDFMIEHYRPALGCQFEVYADILTDETIEYLNRRLPSNYFRFEIGIQSTYEPTNAAVKRKQDFDLLAANIKKIMDGGKIDLHLDLIAGLPYETFDRFSKSFNDVFALGAKEVQLGFLKMLRGTGLRNMASRYGYRYDANAPYEILSNNDISVEELNRIRDAEEIVEKYWNSGKFFLTMTAIFNQYYPGKYFEFFDKFGQYYKQQNYKYHRYQFEDLFRYIHSFLQTQNIDLFDELRTDYYNNFEIRPHGFWTPTIDKKTRKQLLYQIGNDKDFLTKHHLDRKTIEKQTAIDPMEENKYLLTIFAKRENLPFPFKLIYCTNKLVAL